jgi:hypothetical protein
MCTVAVVLCMHAPQLPSFSVILRLQVIICIAAPFFAFTGWVEDRLVLQWRAYLTKVFLAAYFQVRVCGVWVWVCVGGGRWAWSGWVGGVGGGLLYHISLVACTIP